MEHQYHFQESAWKTSLHHSHNTLCQDVPLLGFKTVNSSIDQSSNNDETKSEAHLSTLQRIFEEVESTGSEVTYRCTSCRSCKNCKNHDEIESISIKEEAEQSIIDASVKVDLSTQTTTANLPLIADPLTRLVPNKTIAMKVYQQQIRKFNNPINKKDKKDIIESEAAAWVC